MNFEFVESSIEYDEEEVLDILKYAWEILSQDKKKFLESKLSQVELVDISIEDWKALKIHNKN